MMPRRITVSNSHRRIGDGPRRSTRRPWGKRGGRPLPSYINHSSFRAGTSGPGVGGFPPEPRAVRNRTLGPLAELTMSAIELATFRWRGGGSESRTRCRIRAARSFPRCQVAGSASTVSRLSRVASANVLPRPKRTCRMPSWALYSKSRSWSASAIAVSITISSSARPPSNSPSAGRSHEARQDGVKNWFSMLCFDHTTSSSSRWVTESFTRKLEFLE